MLFKIINQIKNLFTPTSEQHNLDTFISSKHPTSVAEVEYWTKVYDSRQRNNGLLFNYPL